MIEVKDLYFKYGKVNPERGFTLGKISLSVNRGEFIGIFGPNGSGKSTLLKLLTGFLSPERGSVHLDGKNISGIARREMARKIAFVPQSTLSVFPYTVYEIVAMGRTPYLGIMGFERREDNAKIEESLKLMELRHLSDKGINEISGGEAQRVYIARALAQEPEVILLDEPNAHLDIKYQISIFELLKKLNKEKNITIISVSHDLNLSAHYCKRAVLLNHGQLVLDDELPKVLTQQHIREVFDIETKVEYDQSNKNYSILIKP